MNIDTQLKKGKETVALRIAGGCPDYSKFGFVCVDVVFVRPNGDGYNNSLGFYDNYYGDKHHYKGLTVNATMHGEKAQPFDYKLTIDSLGSERSVSLEDARSMVKILAPIERKLKKIEDAEGFAGSFEEYVVRLGRVLGAKAFFAKSPDNIQCKLHTNMGEMRRTIRDVIDNNQKQLGFSEVA